MRDAVMEKITRNIKRNIVVKLDYDIVVKLDAMVRENKKLHYRSQVINNILREYFNTRMK